MARTQSALSRTTQPPKAKPHLNDTFDDLTEYAPDLANRTKDLMDLKSEEIRAVLKAELDKTPFAGGVFDPHIGLNNDDTTSSEYEPLKVKLKSQGESVVIDHRDATVIVQKYMSNYSQFVSELINAGGSRVEIEQRLTLFINEYRGLIMNQYRDLFYILLDCAPRVLLIMLRFDFFRDLFITPHDLVKELDLHRTLREANANYDALVRAYETENRARILKRQKLGTTTKYMKTTEDVARYERLAYYYRLKNSKQRIPNVLLQALAADEQALLQEQKHLEELDHKRLADALKGEYNGEVDAEGLPVLPEELINLRKHLQSYKGISRLAAMRAAVIASDPSLDDAPESADDAAYESEAQAHAAKAKTKAKATGKKAAAAATSSEAKTTKRKTTTGKAQAPAEQVVQGERGLSAEQESLEAQQSAATADAAENPEEQLPLGELSWDDFEQMTKEEVIPPKPKPTSLRKHRTMDDKAIPRPLGMRNLSSNYMVLSDLAQTTTEGPLDVRNIRYDVPMGFGRRVLRPQTFEVRRQIDSISAYMENDRRLMFSALRVLCANQAKMQAIFGDNLKRFNITDKQFCDRWILLEPLEQPCLVLFVGELIELRSHYTRRFVYDNKQLNLQMLILNGLDFRLNSLDNAPAIRELPREKRRKLVALAKKRLAQRADSYKGLNLFADEGEELSEEQNSFFLGMDNNAHTQIPPSEIRPNIQKASNLSPFALIYVKL